MRPTPGVEGPGQLVVGLVVAVQDQAVGGHAGGQGHVQLAARGHVEVHALLVGQPGHGHAQERLGRVGHAVAEGGHRLAAAGPQVVLVVDEQRRAELGGQVERGRSPPMLSRPSSPDRRRCRAGAPARERALTSSSGALTPSRSSPMARPIRAASTSHSRAWVSSGSTLVAHHVAVVVEAVEAPGQLADPGRDLVGRPARRGPGHHLGQLGERAQQLELALVGEQAQVDVGERRPARRPARPPCARSTGSGRGPSARRRPGSPSPGWRPRPRSKVCGLSIDCSRKVSRARRRRPRRATSSSSTMSPVRFDSRTGSPSLQQVDQLGDHDLELVGIVAEGLHRGLQPRDVAVVVGAPHVDEQVEAPGELVPVVGDVGQQVGVLAVGLDEHPVLVVAEVGRPQPGGAVGLVGHLPLVDVLRLVRGVPGQEVGQGLLDRPRSTSDAR